MKHPILLLGALVLSIRSLPSSAAGIPIIHGGGEELIEMGQLPPEVSASAQEDFGCRVTVGFRYERAHIYYLNIWTWNGRHVLHCGDNCWEPTPEKWRELIGEDPSARYGKPVLYRIPLLPALFTVIAVGYVLFKKFFKSDEQKLLDLMLDKRYRRAIETVFGKDREDGGPSTGPSPIPTVDKQKFLMAKDQLVAEGESPHDAQANLQKVVDKVLANASAGIDAYLELAARLDQEGEWDRSAGIYSQVISVLPDTDDRVLYAQNCLTCIDKKRAARGAEERGV